MSKQRERVRKILDWEELEKAPNTRGAFSFLKSAAEIVSIRRNDNVAALAETDNPTTVAVSTTVVEKQRIAKSKPEPRLCRLAQDAHSLGEAALYQMLWGRGERDSEDTRTITIGWRTMQRYCGMTDKNCKRNAKGLIRKLAIEEICPEDGHTRTGRTYRVHSYASILARREAAGLAWVTRDRSRRFVQQDGAPLGLQSAGDSESIPTTVVELPHINSTTVVAATTGTVVATTPGTGVATTTPLVQSLVKYEEVIPSTTTEVDSIVQALADQAGVADSGAAVRLIETCRAVCPDATVAEIIGIVKEKASAARSKRDVRNPIGFLLATVPPVFDGHGIVSYRRMLAAEADAARQKEAERRASAQEFREYLVQEQLRLKHLLSQASLTEGKRIELEKRLRECERVASEAS